MVSGEILAHDEEGAAGAEVEVWDDHLPAAASVEGDRGLVVGLRGQHRGRRLDTLEQRVVQGAADSAAPVLAAYVQLGELQVPRREPPLGAPGAELGRDAVVPPLSRLATVAVDEADEQPAGEGAEKAEAVALRVARQDLVDAGARRVRPDLGERALERENLAPPDLADLDADVDRHGTTSSRPKYELEAT